jgi:membrane protein DedA with SNARE-associated domain
MRLEHWIAEYGTLFYLITFAWTFLEGETFVLCAGFLAAQGLIDPWILFICAWLGSFSGDQLYFWVGRHFGPRLLQRFPRWRGGVDMAFAWLKRYSTVFILSFRFIYGVRNFSSFALGMSGLQWQRFLSLNFLAAAVWATAFVGAGYVFGHVFRSMLGHVARDFSIMMLVVFAAMFGIMFLVHRIQKRRMMTPPRGAVGSAVPPS